MMGFGVFMSPTLHLETITMPYTFKCPKCSYSLTTRGSQSGRKVTCPKCRNLLSIPEPDQTPMAITPEMDHREIQKVRPENGVDHSQSRQFRKATSRLPYVAIIVLGSVLVAENVWLLTRPSGDGKTVAATEHTAQKEIGSESGREAAQSLTSTVATSSNSVAQLPTIPKDQPKPNVTVYVRNDFKSRILGKSATEVIDAVGRPDRTREETVINCWYYVGITKDPITNKVDSYAIVSFDKKGKVESVSFP